MVSELRKRNKTTALAKRNRVVQSSLINDDDGDVSNENLNIAVSSTSAFNSTISSPSQVHKNVTLKLH